jgi:hypothetical protein
VDPPRLTSRHAEEAKSRDPLADITDLEQVKFVMKGGQVFKNELK